MLKIKRARYFSIHTHSNYSVKDGIGSVSSIVTRARELGYRGLALTDHGNIAGTVELYQACRANGIKPFPGSEMYLVEDRNDKASRMKRYHFGVIAYTEEGYRNLVHLSTLSHQNFFHKPIVDLNDLAELSAAGRTKGLALTTGCHFGYVTQTLLNDGKVEARRVVKALSMWFDVYVEIQNHRIEDNEERWVAGCLADIADDLGLHIVLGQDSHYVEHHQQEVHDAMKRMSSWGEDPDDATFPGDGFHLVDDAWMIDHHGEELYEKAMLGHEDLLAKHTLVIPEMESYSYKIPKLAKDPDEALLRMAEKGLDGLGNWRLKPVYRKRLDAELETIRLAGMSDYFILVSNVCKYMRDSGIEYQTRGSAAGSLVAYALGITNVDPIRWGTSFDRFMGRPARRYKPVFTPVSDERCPRRLNDLADIRTALEETRVDSSVAKYVEDELTLLATNEAAVKALVEASSGMMTDNPDRSSIAYTLKITYVKPEDFPVSSVVIDRKSPPDIDLDVDNLRRGEVIEWLNQQYSVVQIGNWMEMGFKSDQDAETGDQGSIVVKYMAAERKKLKKLGKTPAEIDEALQWHNIPAEDRRLIREVAALRPFSNAGTHACGLILTGSQDDMDALVPKMWIPGAGGNGNMVSQFNMKNVEAIGLVKLDLLGSKTVSVMSRTAKDLGYANIEALKDDDSFGYSDSKVFQGMSRGATEGVFQLEGYSSMLGVKRLKPRKIADVIAAMALFRPAAMDAGATDEFLENRERKNEMPKRHDLIASVTEPTNDVLLYQDQIIDILRSLGMNPDDLTAFLKAVKASNNGQEKAKATIDHYMPIIHRMCESKGIPEDDWLWLEHAFTASAGYGFNKCSSGSTVITRSSGNQYQPREITIEELYNIWHGPNTPARKKYRSRGLQVMAHKEGRIKTDRVVDVHRNGVRSLYRMTLENGMYIDTTEDHRHLTMDGWKKLDHIQVGEMVATMGELEKFCKPQGSGAPAGLKNGTHLLKRAIRKIGACEVCSEVEGQLELAHLDGDRSNNTRENLRLLCNSHHKQLDWDKGERKARHSRGRLVNYSPVVSIKYHGEEMTYDLEMEGDDHSWVGNGIVTHNSHATVYGITAYVTQWMRTYHPDAFFASLLSVHISDPDKVTKYESTARRNKVRILGAMVGVSASVDYKVAKPGVIRRPLRSVKGVGEIAARHIEMTYPVTDLGDFLARVNRTKVSGAKDFDLSRPSEMRGVMRALYDAGALEDLIEEM